MSKQTPRETVDKQRGLGYNILHSIINQYWFYALLSPTVGTVGMLLASVKYGWRWDLWIVMCLFLVVMDLGMKTLDLADEELTVDMNSSIQRITGIGMLCCGVILGILLAYMSTWWFLGILLVGTIFGLSYNLEWFDGYLHDRKYPTGWGNLGFCIGWLCTITGYFLLSEKLNIGIAIFSLGPMLGIGTIAYVEGDLKKELYESVNIRYSRELNPDIERLKSRSMQSNILRVFGYICMAVGLLLLFQV